MVTRANVLIDAEFLARNPIAHFQRPGDLWPKPTLSVELAFGLGDDDFRPPLRREQSCLQHVTHRSNVVGARDRPHPFDADAARRFLDGIICLARRAGTP